MIEPIPDRRYMTKCFCGKYPRIGTRGDNKSRVACMRMAKGCGRTTSYYPSVREAEDAWERITS